MTKGYQSSVSFIQSRKDQREAELKNRKAKDWVFTTTKLKKQ